MKIQYKYHCIRCETAEATKHPIFCEDCFERYDEQVHIGIEELQNDGGDTTRTV